MPKILIHNIETNEAITREMNDEELARFEADKLVTELAATQAQTKEATRQALLDKLGITADEAKLLLG